MKRECFQPFKNGNNWLYGCVFWPSILANLYFYWGNISGLTLFFKGLCTKPVQFYKAHVGQIMGLLTFLQFHWQGCSLKAVQDRKFGIFWCFWLVGLVCFFLYDCTYYRLWFLCFIFYNKYCSPGRGLAWLDSWDIPVVLSKEQGDLSVKLRLTNHAHGDPSCLPGKATSAEVPMFYGVCKHCCCLVSVHRVWFLCMGLSML